jgi:hypothetical protein
VCAQKTGFLAQRALQRKPRVSADDPGVFINTQKHTYTHKYYGFENIGDSFSKKKGIDKKKPRVICADTRFYNNLTSSGRLANNGAHTPGFFKYFF